MKDMKVETVVVGALETNCYLVYCQESLECAVIDPGADPDKIFRALRDKNLNPVVLINTHGHVDHIGANQDIKERFDIPLLLHQADLPLLQNALLSEIALLLGARKSPDPDGFLSDGQEIRFGRESLKVLATPGHSPGGVCLLGQDLLLSGDTLFFGGVGRTDLPGGSWDELVRSIRERIFTLPGNVRVYPGHGPSTSVESEKDTNPYLG
jgi:glyoxylase-like metal-dependent hydrolase (beta-lactamase superfamily II)